jgi:hypothetical protein
VSLYKRSGEQEIKRSYGNRCHREATRREFHTDTR